MAHDEDSVDNDTGDELNDMDSFLAKKDKQWTKPPAELTTTDLAPVLNLDEHFEIRVVEGAVENSSPEPSSTKTIESTPQPSSPSADGVASDGDSIERGTKLTLHKHKIVGSYVTEETFAWRLDPELLEMFTQTRQIAVTEMTAEEIIVRYHKMDRSIQLIRMQQQGLNSALPEVLDKLNDEDRQKYHELNRQEALKNQTRTRIERTKKKATGETKAAPKKAGKTESMKRVDFFKLSGFTKEYALKHFKDSNRLDAATLAYIEKLTW